MIILIIVKSGSPTQEASPPLPVPSHPSSRGSTVISIIIETLPLAPLFKGKYWGSQGTGFEDRST